MIYDQKSILLLLRLALLGEKDNDYINQIAFDQIDWNNAYQLFKEHAIVPLMSDIARYIPESYSELSKKWKSDIYQNVYLYSRLVKQQEKILAGFEKKQIPVVVLKGTSAAKYYPKPQLRTMGDIDLLVKTKDYEYAVDCLVNLGCIETSSQSDLIMGRHRCFDYNEVSIELHYYFSFFDDIKKANELDELLYNAISSNNSELPDDENGLVLLSHIGQHLKGGLGLRHILDWMLFAQTYLDDTVWYSSFCGKAQKCGLETLAKTTTKMCQMYLGLKNDNLTWCENANAELCDSLMLHVLECGNLGKSRNILQSSSVEDLPTMNHPIQLFKFIQMHGEKSWKVLKKYPQLKSFAWIFQSCRYIKMAVKNKIGVKKIVDLYRLCKVKMKE